MAWGLPPYTDVVLQSSIEKSRGPGVGVLSRVGAAARWPSSKQSNPDANPTAAAAVVPVIDGAAEVA
jgi:hypothetical protein